MRHHRIMDGSIWYVRAVTKREKSNFFYRKIIFIHLASTIAIRSMWMICGILLWLPVICSCVSWYEKKFPRQIIIVVHSHTSGLIMLLHHSTSYELCFHPKTAMHCKTCALFSLKIGCRCCWYYAILIIFISIHFSHHRFATRSIAIRLNRKPISYSMWCGRAMCERAKNNAAA